MQMMCVFDIQHGRDGLSENEIENLQVMGKPTCWESMRHFRSTFEIDLCRILQFGNNVVRKVQRMPLYVE